MTPEQVRHLEDLRLKELANKRLILKGRRNELEEIRIMLRSPRKLEEVSGHIDARMRVLETDLMLLGFE